MPATKSPRLKPTHRTLGSKSGTENVTLSTNEMPSHGHTVNATNEIGNKGRPEGHLMAAEQGTGNDVYGDQAANTTMNATMIANAGGGQAHNNMQPFLTLNYCIALEGIYPSRS